MKLLEKILLATDFSKSSVNLLDYGIGLAKTFQSQIILVHVLPDNIENEKVKLLLIQAAFTQLKYIRDKIISEGLETGEPVLEFGSPYDKIIKVADNVNANVVLIGSGEISKNDVCQLGITANKIIRKSNKPVWVVKQGKVLNIKSILCPVDFSPESKRGLKNTITIARWFNAKLIIFSVCESYISSSARLQVDWDKENEQVRLAHERKFNLFFKDFNLTNLDCNIEIKVGYPDLQILSAIARYKSDLLIMGTTGKSGFDRLMMGSVTEKVIRKVPCSFITLKNEDVIDVPLETKIREIESHYSIAEQLRKDGYLKESINEYKICLNISDMHIPSLSGIAEVYTKLGDIVNAREYKNMAREVLNRVWDKKIEAEIRKFYNI